MAHVVEAKSGSQTGTPLNSPRTALILARALGFSPRCTPSRVPLAMVGISGI